MADEVAPQCGQVWIVKFSDALGGEIEKTRPAIIVSNNTANALLNRVQVVPLSSSIDRLYPAETYVNLAGERRKAMADQITTASKRRLLRAIGALVPEDLAAVERVVRLQLGL